MSLCALIKKPASSYGEKMSAPIHEGPIQSSIAIANGCLFIRTAENLYCIGK